MQQTSGTISQCENVLPVPLLVQKGGSRNLEDRRSAAD